MKPLKQMNKKDRKFINYRAAYCNPRGSEEEREKLQKKWVDKEKGKQKR